MMFFRDKKQAEVLELIDEYLGLVGEAVVKYRSMVEEYLAGSSEYKEETLHIHEVESKADKLRYKIERKMFKGAFLPAYREDYIELLETLDRVANKSEEAGDLLYLTRPSFPEALHDDLREIANITVGAWEPVPQLVRNVLGDQLRIKGTVRDIAHAESDIDRIQFMAIRRVYRQHDELDTADKLVLKLAVDQLCQVSDRIENVADVLHRIAIKRRMA